MGNVKKKKSSENKDGFKDGLKTYFKGVKTEWGKITWPERKQVFVETLVVIGIVIFFTAAVYIIDIVFKGLLGLIPGR